MTKRETELDGVFLIDLAVNRDERGETIKSYSTGMFEDLGLPTEWTQTLRVSNTKRATLRGLHWQAEPHPETKLVHCLRGRVFDALVDVRPDSPTFGAWAGFELSADAPVTLFVPPGIAHGYMTLENDSELLYQIAGDYRPESQRVLHWDDPSVGIKWPFTPCILAPRDAIAPPWGEVLAPLPT